MAPIIGKAHVAYIPNERVVGLSKLARVVEVFSKRLQTQERLTMQIANTLMGALDAKGVAVTILRLRLIMGKGRLGIMKKLFKSIFHNLPVPLVGNGKNCYQMVSVKDCSEATLLSVEKKIPNCELNLGSEVGPDVKTLLNYLIKKVSSKSIILPLPAFPLKILLLIFEKMGLPILHKEQYKIADKNSLQASGRLKSVESSIQFMSQLQNGPPTYSDAGKIQTATNSISRTEV